MGDRTDVRRGTPDLPIRKTPEAPGPLHRHGVARRPERAAAPLACCLARAEES